MTLTETVAEFHHLVASSGMRGALLHISIRLQVILLRHGSNLSFLRLPDSQTNRRFLHIEAQCRSYNRQSTSRIQAVQMSEHVQLTS
jgi:hypothetical protein